MYKRQGQIQRLTDAGLAGGGQKHGIAHVAQTFQMMNDGEIVLDVYKRQIQDFVEHQIMAHGAFEVAKRYITYRYTLSLIHIRCV